MTKTVLISKDLAPAGRKVFTNAGVKIIEVDEVNNETLLKYADQVNGAIVLLANIDNSIYSKLPHLQILARDGVGYNNIDYVTAGQNGVWVTITPRANHNTVAEAILGAILMLARDTYQRHNLMMDDNWAAGFAKTGHDINGQTLGIIGYGRIGHSLAQKASALGMNILVNNGSHHKDVSFGQEVSLDELLSHSDYISLTAPVTADTTKMINKETLAKMKSTASLINFGRGQLVNTTDLIAALQNGEIHSAALDAYDEEPLPMDSPLRQLPNVFLTPHIGGGTLDARDRGAADAASEIVRVLNGEDPQWPVNQITKD